LEDEMKQQGIVRVFVGSPSDVKPEREALEEVIQELNDVWSQTLGLSLHLVRWETHTYPGFSEDAQAVIQDQIGDDYDIFIGILWTRFGTPTQRSESGTLEEFERAHERFRADPSNVKIMFYFKEEAIAPSKVDVGHLERVQKFRSRLGELGALYWNFETIDDFKKYLRMHLSRQIRDLGGPNKIGTTKPPPLPLPVAGSTAEDPDEEGFLDLIEEGTDYFSQVSQVSQRITG
jgi:hypothetical protein